MGFLSGIGNALNSLTGVSASARQANRYNTALARMSYASEKEFAQNAHQWEMNDLQAAGLNPALTTGASSAGSVASAGGVGNSATSGTSGATPFDIVNMLNQTSAVKHDNKLKDANATYAKAQAIATIEMLPINKKEKQALIRNLDANTKFKEGVETTNTRNQHWFKNRFFNPEDKEPYKEPTKEQRKQGYLF